jgi:hypothetical protein
MSDAECCRCESICSPAVPCCAGACLVLTPLAGLLAQFSKTDAASVILNQSARSSVLLRKDPASADHSSIDILKRQWTGAAQCRCRRGACAPARRSAASGRAVHFGRSGCRRAVMVSAVSRRVACLAGAVPILQAASPRFCMKCKLPLHRVGPLPSLWSVYCLTSCLLRLTLMLTPAGLERQPLAAARQAASGLLAGLAAAAVTLSAGPAGAEVRMPPIDRNGERLHRPCVTSRMTVKVVELTFAPLPAVCHAHQRLR